MYINYTVVSVWSFFSHKITITLFNYSLNRFNACRTSLKFIKHKRQLFIINDSSCSWQVQSNRPGTDPGYEDKETGCILTVLRVSSIIRVLRSADVQSSKVI